MDQKISPELLSPDSFPDKDALPKFGRTVLSANSYYYNYSDSQFKAKFSLPANYWYDFPKVYAENYFTRLSPSFITYKGPIVQTKITCKDSILYDQPTFYLPEEEEKELPEFLPSHRKLMTVQDGSMLFNYDYGGVVRFTSPVEVEFTIEVLKQNGLPLPHKKTKLIIPTAKFTQ